LGSNPERPTNREWIGIMARYERGSAAQLGDEEG
jgi:hypothetical protein